MARTCLLIEDDRDDQEIFTMALREVDAKVECVYANNGFDALKLLQQTSLHFPDFIIIDVNMPRMNGLACLQEIKKMTPGKDVRIIMYSTSSEGGIVNESKALGANDFFVKPSSFEVLIHKLKEIFL